MFVVSKHPIVDENFEESARKAIHEVYSKKGHAPNAVLVHPNTTTLQNIAVGLGDPIALQNIPVIVRTDLAIGFSLSTTEFMLDVGDPNDPLE